MAKKSIDPSLHMRLLMVLDDQHLQFLLRQCDNRTLARAIEELRDGQLLHRFLKNMSNISGGMLLDELIYRWSNFPPDSADPQLRSTTHALASVVETIQTLAANGHIVIPHDIEDGFWQSDAGLEQGGEPQTLTLDVLRSLFQEIIGDAGNSAHVTSDEPLIFSTPHLAWLACLGALFRKVNRDGLMSLENTLFEPTSSKSLLFRYPQVMKQPYMEFAIDILHLPYDGKVNTEDMEHIYIEPYIEGLTQTDTLFDGKAVDPSLLHVIGNTLIMFTKGYLPLIAIECGRQAVPWKNKPSFHELQRIYYQQPFRAR